MALLTATARCGGDVGPTCATSPTFQAVAEDPNGNVYGTGYFSGSIKIGARVLKPTLSEPADGQSPFLFSLAPSGDVKWAATLATDDGSPLTLLSPASGGVVVVGGGAYAQRFDENGQRQWAVGSATQTALPLAALSGQDHLMIAEGDAFWLFDASGDQIAAFSLPSGANVSEVVGDGGDGFWLLGSFVGTFLPWVTMPLSFGFSSSPGLFILRVDSSGAVAGGGAWDTNVEGGIRIEQMITAFGSSGVPELVLLGTNSGAAPSFGLAARGNGRFVAGLDSSAHTLWADTRVFTSQLVTDSVGNLFSLAPQNGRSPSLAVERWDGGGGVIATTTIPGGAHSMTVPTAPAVGGILVLESTISSSPGSECVLDQVVLLRVATADLQVETMTLNGN